MMMESKSKTLIVIVASAWLFLVCTTFFIGTSTFADTDEPSFGSGIFGEWGHDEYGLAAYTYTMRHNDPKAIWDPKVYPPTNLQWHHLGNDRINANAYNRGMVKMFYAESGAMWINEYEPEKNEHTGGFGWLIYGDTVLVDLDDCVPESAGWERVFGTGYFLKRTTVPGLEYERRVYAPAGDYPVLVSEVTVTNLSSREINAALIEYWDVNMRLMKSFLMGRGNRDRLRDSRVRLVLGKDGAMLTAVPKRIFGPHGGFPEKPMLVDPELPQVFMAGLDAVPEAWIIDPDQLFLEGKPRMDPTSLLSAGKIMVPSNPMAQNKVCLAARTHLIVPPGSARTLRFIYGYAKGRDPAQIVDEIKHAAGSDGGALWKETARYWQESSPGLSLENDKFLERELAWDYYYFTASSLFDAYYQRHHIPQGANYFYYSGGNGATRDYGAFVQALSYYKPELAREVLEFMMRCQETDGRLFYDIAGYGTRYNVPYRPGDLDLWFLWALTEYVFATRDFSFLDKVEAYYPLHKGEQGTVWEHAVRSLDHLANTIGTGPHGHPRLRLSDWNDEMMWLSAGSNPIDMIATFVRGESVMNTAMACLIMPMFRELAVVRGDKSAVDTADAYLAKMKKALDSAWHEDHLVRAYSGLGHVFGDDEIYLEPQAWALLAGDVLGHEREKILIDTIVTRLKEPSALGMMISSSTSGSLTTRPGEQEEGGIWFAINGPAAVALAAYEPELAWDEVVKNSLGQHGHVYPETWYGIWSGPDAWNSVFSDRPNETWYMKTPFMNTGPQMYPIQNAHAHCQTMWAIARIAGVKPTREGWTITPMIPMDSYSFNCALFGIEVSPQRISGYAKLAVKERMELRVKVPESWDREKVVVRAGSNRVTAVYENSHIVFTLEAQAGKKTAWEIFVRP